MEICRFKAVQRTLAVVCAFALATYPALPSPQNQAPPGGAPPASLSPDQLDSLVAPIALYPDPLLSQVLVASTYPLEIVEAGRWLKQNSNLTGKDLVAAASKQSWDASVQAMVAFPAVLKQLDANISWTTDLGNAFLAQQSDVMQAIQRMRSRAQEGGKLQSTAQQTVSTGSEGNTTYIAIQPANPQVIYVPVYDPAAIWGPPPAYYPYPPVGYSAGAITAASAISFGAGIAVGALWSGGGWGWNAGWGHNNVVINNNFINNNHFNRVNVANGNVWQHNSFHRQGVPYANRDLSNRFNAGNMNRMNRPTVGQTEQRLGQAGRQMGAGNLGAGNMGARGGVGQRNPGMSQPGQRPNGSANRSMGAAVPGAGGERIGNRQVGGGNFGGAGRSAFGDMNMGGGRAQMNANRGFASRGGFGGPGGFRGGGGGGFRGGGGRRR